MKLQKIKIFIKTWTTYEQKNNFYLVCFLNVRQICRRTGRLTDVQTDLQTYRQTYRRTDRLADVQTDLQTYGQTYRHTDRITDVQADLKTYRQT